MIKESHLSIEIIIAIVMFSAVYSTRKTDYGTLTACLYNNQTLYLDCFYPTCEDNTPFNCDIYENNEDVRTLIASSDWKMVNSKVLFLNATSGTCQLIIKNNATMYHNKTETYVCRLSRKTSQEERNITVKYGMGKEGPKKCSGGPIPHAPGVLWTLAFLFFQETYL